LSDNKLSNGKKKLAKFGILILKSRISSSFFPFRKGKISIVVAAIYIPTKFAHLQSLDPIIGKNFYQKKVAEAILGPRS